MRQEEFRVLLIVFIGTAMLLLASIFIIVFLFYFRRKQRENVNEKIALQAQYEQEILTSQIEVQNATMQHIAEELHDNIGQLLSVARINLNIVEESVSGDKSKEFIKQANELVAKSLIDLRSLTKSLDSDFVKDFGLSESIELELQRIRQTRIFDTELHVSGTSYSLGYKREVILFRIVQEVIQNAVKYSEATTLTIHLQYAPTQFELIITDDGKGFDYSTVKEQPIGRSGAGLRNVQRRAILIGGTCEIVSSVGIGTKIIISLPNLT